MPAEAIQHTPQFRRRRFINWFPMGLTYALLYMGRYNLTVSKNALGDLMTKEDFGIIFGVGTVTYAFAFLLNGPLVDKIGGRRGILIAALGAGIMNLGMGLYLSWVLGSGQATNDQVRLMFTLLYAANMYFQSYGAVAIVKVNAHWFHVRERGGFSGIFGTMISSGIFLAFTVNGWILDFAAAGTSEAAAAKWVFFAPAALLFLFFLIESVLLKDRPAEAGFEDFDTLDASSGEEGLDIPLIQIMKRVILNPIILTVALIEFCTGVIRNGVMHWFPIYAKEVWVLPSSHALRHGSWGNVWLLVAFFAIAVGFFFAGSRARGGRRGGLFVCGALVFLVPFLQGGWGGILFVAGVIGANVAGWLSDLFFQSRRAPVAGILYAALAVASIGMFFTMAGTSNVVGWARAPSGPLREGDVIVEVDGKPTPTWKAADAALDAFVAGRSSPSDRLAVPLAVRRDGRKQSVTVTVDLDEGALPAYRLLPESGARDANGSAAPEILALRPGDRILTLAGFLESGDVQRAEFSTWEEVSHAVASVPARGLGQAKWDPEKLMCTSDGAGIPAGQQPSEGVLHALVERGGKAIDMVLRDPAPRLRAGEKRSLKAGPVLHYSPMWLGLIVFLMSIAVIGTHGLLSGTATMDFGGRKGAATAVGMIDGFVYLGTGVQSFALGYLTTRSWALWPVFLFPFGVIGFLLLRRIWYAIPAGKK
jgi:OPA family glycerol-3-phosphate transporter-like MFS transporter